MGTIGTLLVPAGHCYESTAAEPEPGAPNPARLFNDQHVKLHTRSSPVLMLHPWLCQWTVSGLMGARAHHWLLKTWMQTLSSGPVTSSVHNFINPALYKSLFWLANCVQAEVFRFFIFYFLFFLLKKKPHFLVIRQGKILSCLWKLKVEVVCLRWIL